MSRGIKVAGIGYYLPTREIAYVTGSGEKSISGKDDIDAIRKLGLIGLKVDQPSAKLLDKFYEKGIRKHKDYPKVKIEYELKIWYPKRSLDANALYWALLAILSIEYYDEPGWEETIHEGLLDLYAPKDVDRVTGKVVSKRSSKMNSAEFSGLIHGAFQQLWKRGIEIETGSDIEKYWRQFSDHRWREGKDELEMKSGMSADEYRHLVPYCEATLISLDPDNEDYNGHVHHIVTRGGGGPDEAWNYLHLRADVHEIVHKGGNAELIKRYPWLAHKINAARQRAGKLTDDSDDKQLDIF